MSKFEDLVPPLELCKQIPAGKFEESALVWMMRESKDGFTANGTGINGSTRKIQLATREHAQSLKYNKGLISEPIEFYPAPTLQEILITLEDTGEELRIMKDNANPATAALKLWLEMEAQE